MTPFGGLLLALSSLPGWPAWAALGLVLLSSTLWLKRRSEDDDEAHPDSRGDPASADVPPVSDPGARLRELEQTVDELQSLPRRGARGGASARRVPVHDLA
jgi:hypothetical protein